jgi:hypothetical protein
MCSFIKMLKQYLLGSRSARRALVVATVVAGSADMTTTAVRQ